MGLAILTLGIADHVHEFYSSLYRLSPEQVSISLTKNPSQCKKIIDCKLLPGDILIRRYITKRIWLVDKLANPYFTHSAFYLGDNKLVEAIGKERKSENDIQIATLSLSDWVNSDIYNFVIIRPKKYSTKLESIKNNLLNIAEDRDYTFGLPKHGQKKTTCADLIFHQLFTHDIIQAPNTPNIITPDYLFWVTGYDQINFEIVGYHIANQLNMDKND